MNDTSSKPRTAGDVMGGIIAVGILLAVVGGLILVLAWPGETTATNPLSGREIADTVEKTGNAGAAVLGGVVAGLGTLLLNVGLIAWAVSIGVRHADNR